MDIVAIESKTFEQMKGRFEDFIRQIKNLCGDNQDKEHYSHIEITAYCLIRRLDVNVITGYRILRI